MKQERNVHKTAQHMFVISSPLQLALERSRADHFAAEASTRQVAAADREQLAAQLELAQREVAVKQALCEGWQRANQVRRQLQRCNCGEAHQVMQYAHYATATGNTTRCRWCTPTWLLLSGPCHCENHRMWPTHC